MRWQIPKGRYPKIASQARLFIIQWWQEVHYILFCLFTSTNIGKISKPGTVSEFAHPEYSKTVT